MVRSEFVEDEAYEALVALFAYEDVMAYELLKTYEALVALFAYEDVMAYEDVPANWLVEEPV